MKYLFILAVLISSLSCENIECIKKCQRVTISDALPVQFWVNGKQTFNEKEVDGIFRKCFCAPWTCDDNIKLQFSDTINTTYYIKVYDSNGDTLATTAFTKTTLSGRYLYSISFTPRSLGICNEDIQLVITDDSNVNYMANSNSSYSGWQNTGSGNYWFIPNYTTNSAYLRNTLSPAIGGEVLNRLTIDVASVSGTFTFKAYLSESGGSSRQEVVSSTVSAGVTSFDFTSEVPSSGSWDRIELYAEGLNGYTLVLNSVDLLTNILDISVQNNTFVGSLSPWTNVDTGNENWFYSASPTAAQVNLGAIFGDLSDDLRGVLNFTIPQDSTLSFSVTVVTTTGMDFDIELIFDDGSTSESLGTQSSVGTGVDQVLNFSGTLSTIDATHVTVRVTRTDTMIASDFRFRSISDIEIYDTVTIPNSSFASSSDWVNASSAEPWTVGSGTATFASQTPKFSTKYYTPGNSKNVERTLVIPTGVYTYDFKVYTTAITGGAQGVDFELQFFDSTGNSLENIASSIQASDGIEQFTGTFFNPGDYIVIRISSSLNLSGVTVFNVYEFNITGKSIPAKSDCLSIRETQEETVLISYSNHRDFADINSLNVSPDTEFFLRIPAIFFHENFPEEMEVIELSDSREIQLNAQVKATRELQVKHMPYYMHRKTKLALSHQFVEIDDLFWVKQNPYEITKGRNNFPLAKGSCVLTEKDYIKRNIL